MKYKLSHNKAIFIFIFIAALYFLFFTNPDPVGLIILSTIVLFSGYIIYKFRFIKYDKQSLYLKNIFGIENSVVIEDVISIVNTRLNIGLFIWQYKIKYIVEGKENFVLTLIYFYGQEKYLMSLLKEKNPKVYSSLEGKW